jgi:hypothetical protein
MSILSGMCFGQQLFALRIDNEIKKLAIRGQNTATLGFGQEVEIEYETIIELIYYYFSLMSGIPTPGMKLMNLRLTDKPKGNSKLLILCILSSYLFKRIKKYSLLNGWQRESHDSIKYKLWRCLKLMELVTRTLGVANLLSFLYKGFYPSIQYRVAGYNVVSETKFASSLNSVQQYVQARHVLWQLLLSVFVAISTAVDWQDIQDRTQEVATATLNYINSLSATQYLSRLLVRRRGRVLNPVEVGPSIDSDACVACSASTAECPHVADCGHTFCYLCLQIGLLSATENMNRVRSRGDRLDLSYRCPKCSQPLKECNRKTG